MCVCVCVCVYVCVCAHASEMSHISYDSSHSLWVIAPICSMSYVSNSLLHIACDFQICFYILHMSSSNDSYRVMCVWDITHVSCVHTHTHIHTHIHAQCHCSKPLEALMARALRNDSYETYAHPFEQWLTSLSASLTHTLTHIHTHNVIARSPNGEGFEEWLTWNTRKPVRAMTHITQCLSHTHSHTYTHTMSLLEAVMARALRNDSYETYVHLQQRCCVTNKVLFVTLFKGLVYQCI